jgi:AAHS family 4-hydroxybenzoate transporter-like MFS transporter
MHVFSEGRGIATILFWVVNFMNLLNLYAVAVWAPLVLQSAGYSGPTALVAGTVFQVGGTIGAFGLAWLIGRYGFVPMLAANFGVACLSIFMIVSRDDRGSPSRLFSSPVRCRASRRMH